MKNRSEELHAALVGSILEDEKLLLDLENIRANSAFLIETTKSRIKNSKAQLEKVKAWHEE